MATRRRRNGYALKRNTSRGAFTLRMEGKSGGAAAVKKFKSLPKAEQDRRFKKAGGVKALNAWRSGRKARTAASKSWWESGNRPSWHEDYEKPKRKKATKKKGTRKKAKVSASGKKTTGTMKNGRKWYRIGNKFVSEAVYKAKANSRRRRNGLAMKKRRNPSRRRNSSLGGVKLRHNPMSTGIMPIDAVASAVDKVPLVGKPLAPYVAPLAVGAVSGAGVFYLTNLIEDKLPEQVQPYSYALAGCLGAAATLMVPVGSTQARRLVAAGMATVGAGIDVYRHFFAREAGAPMMMSSDADMMDEVMTSEEGMGRYGAWKLQNPYGALAMKQNPGYGAWEYSGAHEYGDAEEGAEEYTDAEVVDAAVSGDDFDAAEGQVLVMGPKSWFKHFGRPGKRMYHRSKGTYSRHAGKRGHRWGWMIKMIGFRGARYIAGLQPQQRMALIRQLKAQAQATVQAHSGNILPSQPSVYESSGVTGAHGYGAWEYSGTSNGAYGAMAYTGGPL